MREVADTVKIHRFMTALAQTTTTPVQVRSLMKHFEAIEEQIYRYPALDARAFRSAVENAIDSLTS